MLSNFIQKPIGMVTILGTAIGGPYAAFETDIGTQIRRSLVSQMGQSVPGNSGPLNSEPSDPNSLATTNTTNGANATSSFQPTSWNQPSAWNQSSAQVGASYPNQPQNTPSNYSNSSSNGPIVSTVYGPATIQPIGPPTQPQPYSSSSNYSMNQPNSAPAPYIETRSGPASVVPGRTDQLWDYTLGTPTLGQLQQQPGTSVGGGTVTDLREVLRFDIVPGWLPKRFARVSTVTSNVQMDGLRVPLITGTQPNDIAGSLTYYFDASQSLKRINLHGLTGDPNPLANLMVQLYQLKPEQTLGGQLFTTRWNNRITSVLHIAPAPVIYAGADHSKYILFLELNQPTNQYGLSEEASEILRTAQATQRW
ncbi:MAG: hypothetical protein NTY15_13775 [Planctomycetota bacterium]|nr:hypothetical protein [Planctomycetota bacterium]